MKDWRDFLIVIWERYEWLRYSLEQYESRKLNGMSDSQ